MTQRVVNEAFADERPHLRPLPLAPFKSVLKLERRVSREGMVSVGRSRQRGNGTPVTPQLRRSRYRSVTASGNAIMHLENQLTGGAKALRNDLSPDLVRPVPVNLTSRLLWS